MAFFVFVKFPLLSLTQFQLFINSLWSFKLVVESLCQKLSHFIRVKSWSITAVIIQLVSNVRALLVDQLHMETKRMSCPQRVLVLCWSEPGKFIFSNIQVERKLIAFGVSIHLDASSWSIKSSQEFTVDIFLKLKSSVNSFILEFKRSQLQMATMAQRCHIVLPWKHEWYYYTETW